ncbi:MAG: PQQ-dependent sugar dehydrogenase [Zavarzinella sp.]|nr:PQQ-dependent sugar dehydrogenase [Zavarzinella sp.]
MHPRLAPVPSGETPLNRFLWLVVAAFIAVRPAAAGLPKPLVTGLKNPESVCVGLDGRVYVTTVGEFDKDGDGAVMVVQGDKAVPFATNLDDPKGLATFQGNLFVADKKKVLRIDRKGKVTVLADEKAFPVPPVFLNDLAVDEYGNLYVSDSGDLKGAGGAIFRIDQKGKVTLVADAKKAPALKTPNGLLNDGQTHLLFVDDATGELHRLTIPDGETEKLAEGFGRGAGLAFDPHGRLYVSDFNGGKVWVIPRPGSKPLLRAEGFQSPADICYEPKTHSILVPDTKAGTITAIPAQVPGAEVDETTLPLEPQVAFPDLQWTGWEKDADGKLVPLRPLVLTHAGDGSNRVFVATQHGVVHVFPNDQKATRTKVFLDIQKKVRYSDQENEEGFLGFCFHPKYKENGEFFALYNPKRLTTVISRFRVSKDDPDRADPASEEEIFRVTRPFWNHAGGTLTFGPDGYLYFVLGDGGAANDPFENGQNLNSLLGKVHRIDVDHADDGKKYAIPKDNPFANKQGAKPEIFAYGVRNPWRISFDRKTGVLWCADVGQNLYEEIDHLVAGGNYGWNRREGLHPFGAKGTGPRPEFIEPIWEYSHDVGKSITGGTVYHGKRLPELDGHYLYADYVTNKLWALKYDEGQKRVVANHPIPDKGVPVMSFGEDETGDVYFMSYTASGRGIFRFARPGAK